MGDELTQIARLDDPSFYLEDPYPVFRRLRREAPVFWYEPGGFWALTRYEDIRYVSSHPELFSSRSGLAIGDNKHPERVALVTSADSMMIAMDPPRHRQLRRLINKGFTPAMVRQLEPRLRTRVRNALDHVRDEVIDFQATIATPIPLYVLTELIGVPIEDRPIFEGWIDVIAQMVGQADPEDSVYEAAIQVFAEMEPYLLQKVEDRRTAPRDDFISRLVVAEIDGERLDTNVILGTLCLLLEAGFETTATLLSGSAWAFAEHPDQWDKLAADPELVHVAVEEMLRWWSPVRWFCRTATQDLTLESQRVRNGDYIVMLYPSANRDETIWEDPEALDIARTPDPMHLAFGFSEHLCLGASLARLEARVVYEELLHRFDGLELAGPAQRLSSNLLINGFARLPVTLVSRSETNAKVEASGIAEN